jgi:hypothetical protein
MAPEMLQARYELSEDALRAVPTAPRAGMSPLNISSSYRDMTMA